LPRLKAHFRLTNVSALQPLNSTNKEKTKVRKQTVGRRQSLLLVTITAVIVLGASHSASAQNGPAPKPDFSAMGEHWEVVEYEYDYTGNVPKFVVIAKPKKKTVHMWWTVTWRDNKGLVVEQMTLMFWPGSVQKVKVGEPVQGHSKAPFKRFMAQVKSITVTEDPHGPEESTAN
jgi:hypothetical protein